MATLIALATALVDADYTPEGWATLQTALQSAEDILSSEPTEEQLAEAYASLQAALNGLEGESISFS